MYDTVHKSIYGKHMNKTEAVKVTLRSSQIKIVKKLANDMFEGNFSMALRCLIDKHKERDNESN
jgi:hypothetical protein